MTKKKYILTSKFFDTYPKNIGLVNEHDCEESSDMEFLVSEIDSRVKYLFDNDVNKTNNKNNIIWTYYRIRYSKHKQKIVFTNNFDDLVEEKVYEIAEV